MYTSLRQNLFALFRYTFLFSSLKSVVVFYVNSSYLAKCWTMLPIRTRAHCLQKHALKLKVKMYASTRPELVWVAEIYIFTFNFKRHCFLYMATRDLLVQLLSNPDPWFGHAEIRLYIQPHDWTSCRARSRKYGGVKELASQVTGVFLRAQGTGHVMLWHVGK